MGVWINACYVCVYVWVRVIAGCANSSRSVGACVGGIEFDLSLILFLLGLISVNESHIQHYSKFLCVSLSQQHVIQLSPCSNETDYQCVCVYRYILNEIKFWF